MESFHAQKGGHWEHEPGRAWLVRASAQRDRNKYDALARAARWKEWFRPATCALIGEPKASRWKDLFFLLPAGRGGADKVKSKPTKAMPTPSLPVLDATAAAIDVGSEQLHVSIAGGPPTVYGTTTGELHALRDYLLAQKVSSVAMEFTGIYWLCAYEVLEEAGLKVVVVNGKYVKNLPGRKTDMSDCQWEATLHAHGLLKPGFVPPAHIRQLQDYMRLRSEHITGAGSHEQHMQKALERMNLKIHDVISDLTGMSGLKMVESILAGQRNPAALLALCDPQIRDKKADRLLAALKGNWKEEHLFALRQAYELWQFYRLKITECDRAVEALLQELAGPEDPQHPAPKQTKRGGINSPQIAQLHSLVYRLSGHKDPTQLPGFADYVAIQVVSEVGTDLQKYWKTEKHFTAWLGLAPGSHQSGKRRRHAPRKRRNRAGRLFCVIARSVGRSVDCGLSGFYQRLKGRRGGLVANVGLARKIAELYYALMTKGTAYVEHGLKKYKEQVAETEQRLLRKLAKRYNLVLMPKPT